MPQRGILVTRDSLLVTRVSPFAKASGDKSSFAEATGDKPHPADCVGTPPLDEELCSATVRAKFPSIGGVAACRRGGKRVRIYPLTLLSFPRRRE